MLNKIKNFAVDPPTANDVGLPTVKGDEETVGNLLGIVFGMTGALAVLMIIILALMMVVNSSNPEDISRAKKGIYYTLIGLVVVLSAEAVVFLLLNNL